MSAHGRGVQDAGSGAPVARDDVPERTELVLIGGRSGVGKSAAASALHDLLVEHDVAHVVIEGDALDMAHPSPWQHGLAARNLAAIWRNDRALGHRRLILTNTVSVLEADELAAALGDDPHVTTILLRASDATVAGRLARREEGASLAAHLRRSADAAVRLEAEAPAGTHRIDTDGRTSRDVAGEILGVLGWVLGPLTGGS